MKLFGRKSTLAVSVMLITSLLIPTTAMAGETASISISQSKSDADIIKKLESMTKEEIQAGMPKKYPNSYDIIDNVALISAGYSFSIAITADKTLYAWGGNGSGQLGQGHTNEVDGPVKVMENVVYADAGGGHAAAIKEDGSLWVWGSNDSANLGNGTDKPSYVPIKVLDGVVDVSAGGDYTAAIKEDGSLWVTGGTKNMYGDPWEYGTTSYIKIMDNVKDVSAGGRYISIIKKDGSLWIWGQNEYNFPINKLKGVVITEPIKIMDDVKSVSSAEAYGHMAVIKTDGSLWIWGDNEYGEHGTGKVNQDAHVIEKVMDDVVQVEVGSDHTIALKEDGTVWGWGCLRYGAAGKYNYTDRADGSNLRAKPMKILNHADYIAAGTEYSFALDLDEAIYAWGNNEYGQLGNNVVSDGESMSMRSNPYNSSDKVYIYTARRIDPVPIGEYTKNVSLLTAPVKPIKSTTIEKPVTPVAPVVSETSIPSAWAAATITSAKEAGLVPVLTGTYKYQSAITREQFAELAVAMVSAVCGKPELTGEKTFTDCSNPDVLLAAELGIVSGVGEGKFAPKTTINREQIASMVDRAIKYIYEQKGIDLTPKASDISKFVDKGQVSNWAKESVGTLVANGIMSGTSATTLSPKDSCTVEQSIMLLYRVYEAAE